MQDKGATRLTFPGVLDARTLDVPNKAFSNDDLPTFGWPAAQKVRRTSGAREEDVQADESDCQEFRFCIALRLVGCCVFAIFVNEVCIFSGCRAWSWGSSPAYDGAHLATLGIEHACPVYLSPHRWLPRL